MLGRFRLLRRLVVELPHNLKLAYCLAFDPRVRVANKAALGAALVLILTPFVNVPEWVPVVGELDVIALTLLATHLFIAAADGDAVAEQERLLRERRSRFDADVLSGRRIAVTIARRFPGRGDEIAEREARGHAVGTPAGVTTNHGVQV